MEADDSLLCWMRAYVWEIDLLVRCSFHDAVCVCSFSLLIFFDSCTRAYLICRLVSGLED